MSETSKAAVAATQNNGIRLDQLSLIGTFGTEEDPRALVRHASGRIVKVEPGERVAGRRVLAIGKGSVILGSGKGTTRLEMPAG